ncbi:MAG: rhomboid family intramembrane serine protease [Candidatus Levybacteria bacterium]|nr:rhomboid family intramembrane serine protease [Candidatus Levybacteria bacterium]
MFPISDSHPTKKFPFVNISIIILTVYVFYLQLTSVNFENFIQQYSLIPSAVNLFNLQSLANFVTAIFLHGGFLHIISNMWFLWIFGDNVEEHLGWPTYILLYLFSGILGNVFQYLLMPNSPVPMIGASGAVAGVLGAYFALFPHSNVKTIFPIFIFLTIINVPAYIMLGYWFLLQIFSGVTSLPFTVGQGGIAFFAHVGGFVVGLLFAKLWGRKREIYA